MSMKAFYDDFYWYEEASQEEISFINADIMPKATGDENVIQTH